MHQALEDEFAVLADLDRLAKEIATIRAKVALMLAPYRPTVNPIVPPLLVDEPE